MVNSITPSTLVLRSGEELLLIKRPYRSVLHYLSKQRPSIAFNLLVLVTLLACLWGIPAEYALPIGIALIALVALWQCIAALYHSNRVCYFTSNGYYYSAFEQARYAGGFGPGSAWSITAVHVVHRAEFEETWRRHRRRCMHVLR